MSNVSNSFYYRKTVSFVSRYLEPHIPRGLCFKDIFRYNFNSFLSELDDPVKNLHVSSSCGEATKIKAPRNYYFDCIVRVIDKQRPKERHQMDAFRIVANKLGILRIDPLTRKSQFQYEV